MEPLKNKKSYAQPETVKHDSMNLVQGSKLYYTYYYKLYYTTLYYYH